MTLTFVFVWMAVGFLPAVRVSECLVRQLASVSGASISFDR